MYAYFGWSKVLKNGFVQYGCGFSVAEGWRNFDASPTLRLERLPVVGRFVVGNMARFPDIVEYGDICKGLPVAANSCEAIYCSHVLEHLSLEDFRLALQNTYEHLKPISLPSSPNPQSFLDTANKF